MTILEAIGRVDALRHNTFTQEEKVAWLAQVDALISRELIQTHEPQGQSLYGYDGQTSLDQELLAPAPYDEMYLHYLCAMMDYHNGEHDRYNRSMGMYQAVWSSYVNFYNRTHRPLGQVFRYF